MDVSQIITDWESGKLTHGELRTKHELTQEQEFAITHMYDYYLLNADTITQRLPNIKGGMTAGQIIAAMKD